jgi:hypothetical protein
MQSYPIEYKVAALIPILLPMLIPLLLAFMREANHFALRTSCAERAKRRKKERLVYLQKLKYSTSLGDSILSL